MVLIVYKHFYIKDWARFIGILFNLENMDKCVALHDYLRRTVYHYYEFYANTFIAMIPFSLIAPTYIVKTFNIDYYYALFFGLIFSSPYRSMFRFCMDGI